ncbi:MAG TPA: phosphoribosylglycinamide formyltransferase [Clostridiales bacterium]|nr:phosphoribosylglycinamide formyltransferase [Clostridiales bacterium]
MKTLAVLISGGGSNLQALIDNIEAGNINAQIGVVISSRKDAYGLVRAQKHGIPTYYISKKDYKDMDAFNRVLIKKLEEYNTDFIVLAGYLNILSSDIIKKYPNRIINVHPSLIPSFCGKGYYGMRVHQSVLDYGVKISGATVHFVDEGTDTGPIILQKPVEVYYDDDVESLSKRVLEVEHELLPKAVSLLVEGKLVVEGRKVKILE